MIGFHPEIKVLVPSGTMLHGNDVFPDGNYL
jgi:hypothetical protein